MRRKTHLMWEEIIGNVPIINWNIYSHYFKPYGKEGLYVTWKMCLIDLERDVKISQSTIVELRF